MNNRLPKYLLCLGAFLFYTLIIVNYAGAVPPPPPPPATPVGNDIVHAVTVGVIVVYGVWRIRKR